VFLKKSKKKIFQLITAAFQPGISSDQVIDYYNRWSSEYEQDLNENVYRGPELAACMCNVLLSDKNAPILDIGAGTGLVGAHLRYYKFNFIDGLEPSATMLQVAKSKNIYRKLFEEGIYADKLTSLPSGTFNAFLVLEIILEFFSNFNCLIAFKKAFTAQS
jgi:predicted TPR repeat methyltransferase